MGAAEGRSGVGTRVGRREGVLVSDNVGITVGLREGEIVGDTVGVTVGEVDGDDVINEKVLSAKLASQSGESPLHTDEIESPKDSGNDDTHRPNPKLEGSVLNPLSLSALAV